MTLAPIFEASIFIQLHVVAACLALLLGPVVLYRRKGDRRHKQLGYVWVVTMLIVATSSWFITSFGIIGPFSPIHGFALLTYWSIWRAMRDIYAGNIKGHEQALRSLYWNGLIIAGGANFLPGRVLNRMVFPEIPSLGWVAILLGATSLLLRIYCVRRINTRLPA